MTTKTQETLIISNNIFNFEYDKDLYFQTIKKYNLANKSLKQLEKWIEKIGNDLDDGEEWCCVMKYYTFKKFKNTVNINLA